MKNVLFVALLSTFTLANVQSSYAGKNGSGEEDKRKIERTFPKPKIKKTTKTTNRRKQFVPIAPMKPNSGAYRYWRERELRDPNVMRSGNTFFLKQ